MRSWTVLIPTLCAGLLLVGCSSQPAAGSAIASASNPASAAPVAATSSAPAPRKVGDQVSNRGITLTVTAARAVDSVDVNETGSRPGSGYEKYTKKLPDAGGRFVMVQAHIINNAKVSLDLTCGLPITTKLVDAQQRNFDAIDDLYKIKGNPECNHQLQPGFESDMTWVYMVPISASVIGWAFQDTTALNGLGDYSTVAFSA
jgi:hypothetical protein